MQRATSRDRAAAALALRHLAHWGTAALCDIYKLVNANNTQHSEQRTNSSLLTASCSLLTQQPANAATRSALPAAAGLPLHWCFAARCAIAARCAVVITRQAADDIVCVRPFILLRPRAKASTRTPPKLWGYNY
jgi:hypothetical protein